MRFSNGKEVESFTAMDNDILTKICRITDLSMGTKDVLISLCRQVFYQNEDNVIRTSWWAAADITAGEVGISERQVRRAYNELAERNIISKELKLRENDVCGKVIPRNTLWITINTDVDSWNVRERRKTCNTVNDVTK